MPEIRLRSTMHGHAGCKSLPGHWKQDIGWGDKEVALSSFGVIMRNVLIPSFGKTGTVTIDGRDCHYSSEAERAFLTILEGLIWAGEIEEWEWQPPAYPVEYKHGGSTWTQPYRADARIVWKDARQDGVREWVIEVKRGYMQPKACAKIKRYCQQYDIPLVLVWYGRLPKSGKAFDKLEMLRKHIHHIWEI